MYWKFKTCLYKKSLRKFEILKCALMVDWMAYWDDVLISWGTMARASDQHVTSYKWLDVTRSYLLILYGLKVFLLLRLLKSLQLPFAFYKVTVLLYSIRYFKKKARINFLPFVSLLWTFSHHQVYLILHLVDRNPKCQHFPTPPP